jgi:hypothetical protein
MPITKDSFKWEELIYTNSNSTYIAYIPEGYIILNKSSYNSNISESMVFIPKLRD